MKYYSLMINLSRLHFLLPKLWVKSWLQSFQGALRIIVKCCILHLQRLAMKFRTGYQIKDLM
uniref:Uncharacterized protein n=1 Tax=Arundo donax TaxID=35708 RepID=A0A0A9DXM8_ARUDO